MIPVKFRTVIRNTSSAFLIAAVVYSCSDIIEPGGGIEGSAYRQLSYDAACQNDTLRLKYSGAWNVESCPEWISMPVKSAEGDIILPLYVQQNDDGIARKGDILIDLVNSDSLTFAIAQDASDNNGYHLLNLPESYGLGWGYDLREDYADLAGIRGQVFDVCALRNDWGDDIIMLDTHQVTNLYYARGESSETLQKDMSGKVSGGIDLKIASAKVSVEFDKQITEQKDRLYVWCRDFRGVRMAYFDNDIDLLDEETVKWCTTYSFRRSVSEDSASEIVRKFGTHLITKSCLGGKLDYYFTVSTDVTTEIEKIITTINAKLLFFKTSHTWVDEKVWSEVKKDFQGNFIVTGGGVTGDYLNAQLKKYAAKGEPLTDPELFDRWYECFNSAQTAKDSDLAMVDFNVIPIWYIVRLIDKEKGDAVKNYIITSYLK